MLLALHPTSHQAPTSHLYDALGSKIAMLVNPKRLKPDAKEVQEAARALGQSVHVLDAASEEEIDMAFQSLAQGRNDALLVVSNPLFTSRREQIVALANYHRVPA